MWYQSTRAYMGPPEAAGTRAGSHQLVSCRVTQGPLEKLVLR